MYSLVWKKFHNNPELKALLLATGDAQLEEGNAWGDVYWGISPVGSGQGENHLGRILMKVRDSFQSKETE